MTTLDNAPGSTPNDSGAGMSRRTLVRTGANALWMVPAIQIATSAPAFAAVSGVPATLAVTNVSGNRTALTGLFNGSVTIQNSGPVASTNPLTCTVVFSATAGLYRSLQAGSVTSTAPAWTFINAATTGSGTNVAHTLTFRYGATVPAGSAAPTLTFNATFTGGGIGTTSGTATMTASATASGDTSGNASAPVS